MPDMFSGGKAPAEGDKSDVDELLHEFFKDEFEAAASGLTAACRSTDFSSATGVDICSDFLSKGIETFLTDHYTPPSSALENPMNYSSMIAAGVPSLTIKDSFSGMQDGISGGNDVPKDQLQWVSSIFEEAPFAGENIQKIPAISGVDENLDSRSQVAARSEVSHPELGSSTPGSKCLDHDSPISMLDWELGGSSGAATVDVRYEKSKTANIMRTLKKRKAARAAAAGLEMRRCLHCQTEKTPQWRTGPEGPKTLCNACGMRFKSGRLVPEYRPASSPSFVASHHSNSHRKVLELRRQKSILDQEQEQKQKQKQRQLLLGTCRLASVFGLPQAMRPLDALVHGPGSRLQFQSPEE